MHQNPGLSPSISCPQNQSDVKNFIYLNAKKLTDHSLHNKIVIYGSVAKIATQHEKRFIIFFYFRPEYYCNPSIVELDDMVDDHGDVIVGDFVVGREGFGMVKFFGEFNVAGLNLDEIGNNLLHMYSL